MCRPGRRLWLLDPVSVWFAAKRQGNWGRRRGEDRCQGALEVIVVSSFGACAVEQTRGRDGCVVLKR